MCTTTQGEMMNKIFKRNSGSPWLEEAIDFVWQSLEFLMNNIAAPEEIPASYAVSALVGTKAKTLEDVLCPTNRFILVVSEALSNKVKVYLLYVGFL